MRWVAIVAAVALLAAGASVAAPDRSAQYHGWRYGAISGSVTLTTTSPRLVCSGRDRDEKRVIRGTYRISFTGTSMRRTRAAADISYNLAAGGPAGNTEPVAMRARRSFEELIQVKTVTENDLGEQICELDDRTCTKSDTKLLRRASNRLNVRMRRGGTVQIHPPDRVGFDGCAADVPGTDLLIAGDSAQVFPIRLFNRQRAVLRFASSRRAGGRTETGAPVTGRFVYSASIGLRRMPGTPPASCRVC